MKCPACNASVTCQRIDGGMVMFCSQCGWGKDRAAQVQRDGSTPKAKQAKPALIWVLLGLLFSIAFVVGPYVALLVFAPPMATWVHVTYWLTMGTYLLIAATCAPTPDLSNLGLFGTPIDNPLSFEDDANRWALKMALLLLPGKLVTVSLTALITRFR